MKTREQLLILRDMIDENPPGTADYQLVIREVLEDLLLSENTIEDTLFALSVVNMTPSLLYDKHTDSFRCMEENYRNVVVYDEEPIDIMTFSLSDSSEWFVSVQEALKSYIKNKL